MYKLRFLPVILAVIFIAGMIYVSIQPSTPQIHAIHPPIVEYGENIRITGANFSENMAVYLNGDRILGFTRISDSEISIPFDQISPVFPRHFLPDREIEFMIENNGRRFSNAATISLPDSRVKQPLSSTYVSPPQPEDPEGMTQFAIDYLQLIMQDHYIVVMVASDDAGRRFNYNLNEQFLKMGLTQSPYGTFRYAYAAVIAGGQVVFEDLGQDDNAYITYNTIVDYVAISLTSAGLYALNTGIASTSIKINNMEYTLANRGLNIVVFDKELGEVVDSVSIDTHASNLRFRRKNLELLRQSAFVAEHIRNMAQENHIGIVVAHQDSVRRFNRVLELAFAAIGLENHPTDRGFAYVAVIADGQVLFEAAAGDDELDVVTYSGTIDDVTVAAVSIGINAFRNDLDNTRIEINGMDYALGNRGLNIVLFDKSLGRVVSSISIDTHDELRFVYRDDL